MKSLMKYGTRNMFISKFHRMAMGVWGRSIAKDEAISWKTETLVSLEWCQEL